MNDICGKDWEIGGDGDHGDPGNIYFRAWLDTKVIPFVVLVVRIKSTIKAGFSFLLLNY